MQCIKGTSDNVSNIFKGFVLNSSLLFIALFSNVSFFVDCCPTIKVTLQNTPKETLERFEGLYNLIGYVNGEKYWLSQDKKWTIYMSGNQNWIIGTLEALGTPRDINAWLYTAALSCPKIDMWKYFWILAKRNLSHQKKKRTSKLNVLISMKLNCRTDNSYQMIPG